MKKLSAKFPILFEIILFVIALLVAAVLATALQAIGCNSTLSPTIARILIGLILLAIFYKSFSFRSSLKGFLITLPILLFGLYKIPYHFISGGTGADFNKVTLTIFLAGLAPAIFEEVLFRGICIANLKKKYNNPYVIVLVSAVIFSLAHVTNLVGMDVASVLLQVSTSLVLGIVWGAIYLRSGDLLSLIFSHFFIDILSDICFSGDTTPGYFLAIMIAILILELAYGLLLIRKLPRSGKESTADAVQDPQA